LELIVSKCQVNIGQSVTYAVAAVLTCLQHITIIFHVFKMIPDLSDQNISFGYYNATDF